jgi:hypothetical protein
MEAWEDYLNELFEEPKEGEERLFWVTEPVKDGGLMGWIRRNATPLPPDQTELGPLFDPANPIRLAPDRQTESPRPA